jgi:hypothetical protein
MKQNEYNILAMAAARSNLGFELPSEEEVIRLLSRPTCSMFDAMVTFCGQYLENSDDNDGPASMFTQEAEGWKKRLEKRHDRDLPTEFPDLMNLFNRAKRKVEAAQTK